MDPLIAETTPSSPMDGQSTVVDTIWFYIGVVGASCIPVSVVLFLWAWRQRKRMDALAVQRAHRSVTIRLAAMQACEIVLAIGFKYGKKEHRGSRHQSTGKNKSHTKHHKNTDHIIDVPFQPPPTNRLRSFRKSLANVFKKKRHASSLHSVSRV
ncbi:hypothetical protein LSAT2_026955 [Lamellibrachia satsuma]|nr:hypothetical protein LSAT2_026955 [Lamellibrachia satsuma]